MACRLSYFVAGLVVVCAGLYLFGFRIYRVPTAAMYPTIDKGGFVVGRLTDSKRDRVERLDLLIYRAPAVSPTETYVKRVIGLPGDRVELSGEGIVINGEELVMPEAVTRNGFGPKYPMVVVPPDGFYVIGDNLNSSLDSRYYGPIQRSEILGEVLFKE